MGVRPPVGCQKEPQMSDPMCSEPQRCYVPARRRLLHVVTVEAIVLQDADESVASQ
jgi:hypothetical protein